MLAKVHSGSLMGIDASPVEVAAAGGHNVLKLCAWMMQLSSRFHKYGYVFMAICQRGIMRVWHCWLAQQCLLFVTPFRKLNLAFPVFVGRAVPAVFDLGGGHGPPYGTLRRRGTIRDRIPEMLCLVPLRARIEACSQVSFEESVQ